VYAGSLRTNEYYINNYYTFLHFSICGELNYFNVVQDVHLYTQSHSVDFYWVTLSPQIDFLYIIELISKLYFYISFFVYAG